MCRHTKHLSNLEKVAITVDFRYKLAACVVIKNNVIGYGTNSKKSDPMQARFARNEHSIYLHAEIAAIKNALSYTNVKDFHKATLYICRVVFDQELNVYRALAKPCSGCARAIETFGFRSVVYSTADGFEIEKR